MKTDPTGSHRNGSDPARRRGGRRPFAMVLALFLFAGDGMGQPTNGNGSITWMADLEAKLSEMGLNLDATNTTRAATLAVVQTIDAKARIITPDEWNVIRDQREGWFYLSGLRLSMSNGLPVVQDVSAGSPAENAGLKVGDVLVEIGTQRMDRISLPAAQQLLRAPGEQDLAIRAVRNNETNRYELTLARLTQPAIEWAELLPNQVGYIKVNGLYAGAGRDLVSQIRGWSETGRDGIILDLRGAGGADEAAILQTASLYAAGGQFLFAYRDHHHQDIQVFKASEGKPVTLPLMVLIDSDTTGAAETLAAVLNHAARPSLLIGETTAGDFNLRDAVTFSDHLIYLATKVVDTADGWRYNGQFGVEPSVTIDAFSRNTHEYEPPVDLLDRRHRLEIEERDAAMRRRVRGDGTLERAVDILIGLKSLNKAPGAVSSPDR
jgi:C-terminal peptidase prc